MALAVLYVPSSLDSGIYLRRAGCKGSSPTSALVRVLGAHNLSSDSGVGGSCARLFNHRSSGFNKLSSGCSGAGAGGACGAGMTRKLFTTFSCGLGSGDSCGVVNHGTRPSPSLAGNGNRCLDQAWSSPRRRPLLSSTHRLRAKKKKLKRVERLLPESQG